MTNVILVDITIPALDNTFDFMLDENTPVDKIIMEVIEMISKQTHSGKVSDTEEFMLCDYKRGQRLESHQTLYQAGIEDGSSLLLV